MPTFCQPDGSGPFRGLISDSSPTALLGLNARKLLFRPAEPKKHRFQVPSPSLGTRGANWAGTPRFFLPGVPLGGRASGRPLRQSP